jgi:hypothetical protein
VEWPVTTTLPIGRFLLQQRWDVSDEQLVEFERWYDEDHLPEVAAVPGVLVGRRFCCVPGGGQERHKFAHVTQYELASLDVFEQPEYKALLNPLNSAPPILGNSRTWYRTLYPEFGTLKGQTVSTDPNPASGVGLMHIMMSTRPECEVQFNRWYNEEHIGMISARPGILHGRRFLAIQGAPSGDGEGAPALDYLANYELESDTMPGPSPEEGEYPTPWRKTFGDRLSYRVQQLKLVTRIDGTAARF